MIDPQQVHLFTKRVSADGGDDCSLPLVNGDFTSATHVSFTKESIDVTSGAIYKGSIPLESFDEVGKKRLRDMGLAI